MSGQINKEDLLAFFNNEAKNLFRLMNLKSTFQSLQVKLLKS